MAINKQPVFTAQPILKVTRIPWEEFTTFDPSSARSSSINILTALDSFGTLIERITIQPMASPYGYASISTKLLYVSVYDYNVNRASILAVKKWNALDMGSTFIEPPYWELTFAGGIILDIDDELLIAQAIYDGTRPTNSGDGLLVTIEGSTYTAP